MRVLWLVKHEIKWGGTTDWDVVSAKVVASSSEQAIAKHAISIKKWTSEDENGKKSKVVGIRLYSITPLENIDL